MATTAQLSYIRQLIRRAEFDEHAITPLYRRLGVPEKWQGARLDDYLASLSQAEASRLIDKLRDAAGEEDDEDED